MSHVKMPSFLIRLYGVCRQADRSLDALLSHPKTGWSGLRGFYSGSRMDILNEVLREVGTHEEDTSSIAPNREGFVQSAARPLVARLFSLGEPEVFHLMPTQARFIARAIDRLKCILQLEHVPDATLIVEMRMDLHACELFIERLVNRPGYFARAQMVEHFGQSEHKTHHPIESL